MPRRLKKQKPDPATDGGAPARRKRRWGRFTVRSVVVLLLVGAMGIVVAIRTNALGLVVLPKVSALFNCDATAGRIWIDKNGRLVIEDLRLAAPGVAGPAAEFLRSDRVEVGLQWRSVFTGSPQANEILMQAPVVRLSQDENLELNVQSLSTGGSPVGGLVPAIEIRRGTVEFGEHGRGSYRRLTEVFVDGRLSRSSSTDALYELSLRETRSADPAVTPEQYIALEGELDLERVSGRVEIGNLDLGRLGASRVPSAISELWTTMAMNGALEDVVLQYDDTSGVSATFGLEGVALNIPVPADPDAADPETNRADLVSMQDVSGEVRFDSGGVSARLTGLIEDLGCDVVLDTDALSLDAGLTCTITARDFPVAQQPRLLPFAPRFVRRNFQRFSGPTAVVDGRVVVSREPPGPEGAAPLSVAGYLNFVDGAAVYESFRYPFRDMRGTVRFDDEEIRIESISGRGPTGATLLATGVIAPPRPGAALELHVNVVDVPPDEHLWEAMPESRRILLDTLFSAPARDDLARQGLLMSGEEASRLEAERDELELEMRRLMARGADLADIERTRARLAEVDHALRTPVFDPAGEMTVDVRITRELGDDTEYVTTIDVSIPRAGVIASAFPYPAMADNLALQITDYGASIRVDALEGLSGAVGTLEADIDFGESPDAETEFDIRVGADRVPPDDYLIYALPAGGDDSNGGFSSQDLVRRLGLSGRGACSAQIASGADGETTFRVDIDLDGLASRPLDRGCELSDLDGQLIVTGDGVRIDSLRGRVGQSGRFEASLNATGITTDAASVRTSASFDDLDLSHPLEHLIEALVPEQGEMIAPLRAQFRPSGVVDASLDLTSEAGKVQYLARITDPRDLGFDLFGGRALLAEGSGGLSIGSDLVMCDNFVADLEYAGEPCGKLSLDGTWPADPASSGSMRIGLTGGQFDSPVVRAIAGAGSEGLAAWLESARVAGEFDANLSLTKAPSQRPMFDGFVAPKSLALTRAGERISFDRVSGRVGFQGTRGTIEDLVAHAPEWTVGVDGEWSTDPAFGIEARIGLEARSLSPDLLALLPEEGVDALEGAELELTGPLTIQDAALTYGATPEGRVQELVIDADAVFAGAEMVAVVPVTFGAGTAAIDASFRAGRESEGGLDVTIEADTLSTLGVPMTDGVVRLRTGRSPGVVTIPMISANVHEGELAARAAIRSAPPRSIGEEEDTAYELELQLAGVDFANLLHTFGIGDDASQPEPAPAVGSRGRLEATFSLTGRGSEPSSRIGRGLLRVQDGEVLELPGVMGLLRLSNLQPPIGEDLEYASSEFFLRGDVLTFEHIEASSRSVVIAGSGTMTWPSTALDLTFTTRPKRRVPLLSDIFEGVRDEFITARVAGTLQEPTYDLVQLPATKRMLGSIFRGEPRAIPPQARRQSDRPAIDEQTDTPDKGSE